MSFANKWVELEIMIVSQESQVQKEKGGMFSLICGRQTQKIIIYTNINRTCSQQ
jgi:hypothetical protein